MSCRNTCRNSGTLAAVGWHHQAHRGDCAEPLLLEASR